MADIVLSIIGIEGQRLAGIGVGKMVGKQICESIRSSFKTDMIEKYKELATAATKSILDNPEELKKLTDALSTTFKGMSIDNFELTSKDSNITGMVAKDTKIGNILSKGGAGIEGGLKEEDANEKPDNKLVSALPEVPSIKLDNPLDGLPGAALIKSAIQGLKPDEGVVPGYLADALNEKVVKEKMIEGFGNFITELTTKNSNDLKKVFLDVLKEQINAKFREGGEFQKTIIDIIQKKCNAKFDPNPVADADADADAGVPEQIENTPNPTEIMGSIDKSNAKKPPAAKEDGQPTTEAVKTTKTEGGKSNKPPKRFTRKILKKTTTK